MVDQLRNIWLSEWLRYTAATIVGFLIALVVETISSYLDRRRLKTAVREALAQELVENLLTLDHYRTVFTRDHTFEGISGTWPTGRIRTSMLERCLDSAVIAALTEMEYNQAVHGLYQGMRLNEKLDDDFNTLKETPRLGKEKSNAFMHEIHYVAQTYIDLLVTVISEQQVFSSTRTASIALKLHPLFSSGNWEVDRTWRSTYLAPVKGPHSIAIVWKNDVEESPEGRQVLELSPSKEPHRTINRRRSKPWTRTPKFIERRWRLWRLRQLYKSGQ